MSSLDEFWNRLDRKKKKWEKKAKPLFQGAFKAELDAIQKTLFDKLSTEQVIRAVNEQIHAWQEAISKTYNEVSRDFIKIVIPRLDDYEAILTGTINQFIQSNSGSKITLIQNTTKKELNQIFQQAQSENLTVNEVRNLIEAKYDDFDSMRSLRIARTEVQTSAGYGQLQGGILSGAENKIWVTSRDSEVRLLHQILEGEKVPILSVFSNGLRFPGDPSGSAAQVINCRCCLIFS